MKLLESYTAHNTLYLPETEIKENKPEYIYVPLRGYNHILAVVLGPRPILSLGWILVTTLGFDSVKKWIESTNWVDQGY